MKWYHKAADQGNSFAQYNIGVLYDRGQGVKQDYNEAMKWFYKAAKQGESYSQFSIGLLYYNGQGVKQDYKEAIKMVSLVSGSGEYDATDIARRDVFLWQRCQKKL